MYTKKTMGYVANSHNGDIYSCEKPSANQPYKVIKTGRVLTRQEERFGLFNKSTDIATIANRDLDYYQVISNQGACERCMEQRCDLSSCGSEGRR